MARIRSIKPEFWDDRKLARSVSRDARLLYIGLWNQSDEHARCNGDPHWIKGRVFPYDDDLTDEVVADLLLELVKAGRLQAYSVDGDPYFLLPKLPDHQRLEPSKVDSRHPAPPDPWPGGPGGAPSDQSAARPDSDESASGADESEPDADESSLLYVAGSMEHGACKPSTSAAAPRDLDSDRPEVSRLCEHLADRIEANGSKRPAVGAKWREAARLMLDRDGRTETQVIAAIDWCQNDPFWRGNILSLPKLRDKYDQLRLAAQRVPGPSRPAGDPYLNDIRDGVYGPPPFDPQLRVVPALEA